VAARSATLALNNVLLPYVLAAAEHGFEQALGSMPELRRGTYLHRGQCTRESLARAFGLSFTPLLGAAAGTGE
jgi:alanine dehydrogenase